MEMAFFDYHFFQHAGYFRFDKHFIFMEIFSRFDDHWFVFCLIFKKVWALNIYGSQATHFLR